MAYIIQNKPQIIDTEDKSIGVSLPITVGNNGYFAVTYTTREQIKTDLISLLNTNKGERLMQPDLGCDLRRAVFEQTPDDAFEVIQNEIESAVERWLPFITINEITYDDRDTDRDSNKLNVRIYFTIPSLGNNTKDSINITV